MNCFKSQHQSLFAFIHFFIYMYFFTQRSILNELINRLLTHKFSVLFTKHLNLFLIILMNGSPIVLTSLEFVSHFLNLFREFLFLKNGQFRSVHKLVAIKNLFIFDVSMTFCLYSLL